MNLKQPVGLEIKDIAFSARGAKLHSEAGQIWHRVANGSLPLQSFLNIMRCFSQALNRGDGPRQLPHASEYDEDVI